MKTMLIATLTTDREQIEIVADEEQASSLALDGYAAPAAANTPTAYAGSAYYTPENGGAFYAPWGNESLDTGLGYFTMAVGAVSVVAVLIFAAPYAWDVITTLIDEFKTNMGR